MSAQPLLQNPPDDESVIPSNVSELSIPLRLDRSPARTTAACFLLDLEPGLGTLWVEMWEVER